MGPRVGAVESATTALSETSEFNDSEPHTNSNPINLLRLRHSDHIGNCIAQRLTGAIAARRVHEGRATKSAPAASFFIV
jgi:hypothetical protein